MLPNLDENWLRSGRNRNIRSFIRVASSSCGEFPDLFVSSQLRGLRRVPISGFPKHLLFYQFDDEQVFILRMVHGAQDLERCSRRPPQRFECCPIAPSPLESGWHPLARHAESPSPATSPLPASLPDHV